MDEETPLKQIRTFQGDVAEALERQRESLVSIQRAEYLRKNTTQSSDLITSENTKRRTDLFFLFLGSFVLFSVGLVGSWYAYNEFVRRSSTPIITTPANRFIATNTKVDLPITANSRETLIAMLSNATENIPSGELRHINLPLPTNKFLETLESRAPGNLVRALNPLFMIGAFGKSPTTDWTSIFLIFKLDSFENTYSGMLEWEKYLGQDIGPLFATAPLLKNVPIESSFTDIIDRNKDIRILVLNNKTVLLYTFFDNNMLIITDNIETLRILLDRLTREKLSR